MTLVRPTDLGSVMQSVNSICDQLEKHARGEQAIVTDPKVIRAWLASNYSDAPPGYIVASGSFTSTKTTTAGTEATALNVVTSSSFTADGIRSVLVSFYAPQWYSGAVGSNQGRLSLFDGSTAKGILSANTFTVQSNVNGPVVAATSYLPAAGSTTLSVRLWSSGGLSVSIDAGAGGANTLLPGIITVAVV